MARQVKGNRIKLPVNDYIRQVNTVFDLAKNSAGVDTNRIEHLRRYTIRRLRTTFKIRRNAVVYLSTVP